MKIFYVVGQHLALADKIVISPLETYNYYRREGSIVRSTFTEKRYEFFDAVAKNEEVVRKEYIQNEELLQSLQAKKILGGFVVIGAKADSGLKDFSKDKELLKVEMSELLKNSKLSWKVKLKYLILCLALNCICCYDSIVHKTNLICNKYQKIVGKRKYDRSF